MAGKEGSKPDAAESLRNQLEHLEMQQEELPAPRPSITRTSSVGTALDRSLSSALPPPRPSHDSQRAAGGQVRFSSELQGEGRSSGRPYGAARPSLQRDSQLYTIVSNVDDATRKRAGTGEASSSRADPTLLSPQAAATSGLSGSYDDDRQIPISLAQHPPRHHHHRRHYSEGFDGNLKDAIVTAAETNVTLAHYRDWFARQREKRRRWTRGPAGRLKARLGSLYRRYVVEGLLRRRPLPPSRDGRHVPIDPALARAAPLVDERTGRPYVSNRIRSTRYTLWDFLPKQLLFQFGKLANFYFLVIGVMQMIPGLSTTGTYTTIAPLLAFVALSMAKEGYDDYRRYQLDKQENRNTTWILDPAGTARQPETGRTRWPRGRGWGRRRGGGALADWFERRWSSRLAGEDPDVTELEGVRVSGGDDKNGGGEQDLLWSRVQWQQVRVGDVVRLRRDDDVPADLVLLHATGPNGVAYIETMALDGETNLKSKQACPLLVGRCASPSGILSCAGGGATVVSEDPNMDLYNFDGRVSVVEEEDGGGGGGETKTMPLTLGQVVYRGSTLRNTSEAVGLVVNTGEECKIRMNAHKDVHAKAPAMQKTVNRIVALLVLFVLMLSFGCTIGYEVWKGSYKPRAWYLTDADVSFKEVVIAFIIAFNTLIPLSLYVSLEIIKLGQFLLLHDVEMYDPVTDTPMVANTTTILENLGQIRYVFSDKTGTLTENVMRFRKMSVAGTAWLHDADLRREAREEKTPDPSGGAVERKASKGKRKQTTRTSVTVVDSQAGGGGERGERRGRTAAAAADNTSPHRTGSVSQWRSTARPGHAPPLLTTEDFVRYLRNRPHSAFSRKARHFILCMALCHTCLPEKNAEGEVVSFQAASPDELALVEAAREMGYLLVDRPAQAIKLQFRDLDGRDMVRTYEVLDVIEFSSRRKRMSVVVRMPDGRVCLFTKGADSAILPRLKLSNLAAQKASAVEWRASKRKSVEQEKALRRRSTQRSNSNYNSNNARDSISLVRAASGLAPSGAAGGGGGGGGAAAAAGGGGQPRRSGLWRRSSSRPRRSTSSFVPDEVDSWLTRRETEELDRQVAYDEAAYASPRPSIGGARKSFEFPRLFDDPLDGMVDENLALNEGAVFERCFQHVDDFSSEGLRTLLFAYRYVDEEEYRKWKAVYHEASTSLTDRQERVEAAAELIEQGFDLAGATAIEDKLQKGVPETMDKLRRAEVKVWMLTGDKRETAVNIAHSARICRPFSELYVLDAARGDLQEKIASALIDVGRGGAVTVPHSVVVIDGHTLGVVEEDESLRLLFLDLAARVDSVLCCRASPAQKALLVKCVRRQVPSALTLAIGDGANDVAMIQAAHVGVGISGREGLQAARVADYAIAQFRFLQRLLFVHGRWNYIRTGKYILGTFWKEIVFYLVQAQYQRYNGYTGTSLYESTSLTVFNTLFTSLPVILLGIFEQDLRAETLLAVPELYTFGQRNRGFSFKLYVWWMLTAATEAVAIFYLIYGAYDAALFTVDASLYAIGDLAFTVCVIFINLKMLVLELHNHTAVTYGGLVVSVGGWFLWNVFLAGIYSPTVGPYIVRDALFRNFGRTATWWLTVLAALAAVSVLELALAALRRVFWPRDQDLMQELEHDAGLMRVLREHAAERGDAGPPSPSSAPSSVLMAPEEEANVDAQSAQVKTTRSTTEVVPLATTPGGGQRNSRNFVGDDYIPPPFTPLAEEFEGRPAIGNGGGGGGGAGGAARKKDRTPTTPRTWILDTNGAAAATAAATSPAADGGVQGSYFAQSPVEMQSPSALGIVMQGGGPRSA